MSEDNVKYRVYSAWKNAHWVFEYERDTEAEAWECVRSRQAGGAGLAFQVRKETHVVEVLTEPRVWTVGTEYQWSGITPSTLKWTCVHVWPDNGSAVVVTKGGAHLKMAANEIRDVEVVK